MLVLTNDRGHEWFSAKQQVLNRRTDKFQKGQNPWPRLIEINEVRVNGLILKYTQINQIK